MAKNPRIKKSGNLSDLTPEQVTEIHRCMYGYDDPVLGRHLSGPVYFARNYARIQHPKKGDVPFEMYPYQEKMIDLYLNNNKVVVLASRQVGKTVVAMAFLLWYAIFVPNKTILIAANRNKNAMEIINKIQYCYEYLPMWMKPGVEDDGWNKHECKFDNKSRIMSDATSESTGRGFSISLLYLDEFAFVAPNVQEEFWTSILPTLSTGGAAIITSTPNGAVDKFATIWRGAIHNSNTNGVQFVPMQVHWDEPPGRDEKFKQDHIAMLGELKWKQEYECAGADTLLTLQDDIGNVFNLTMQELYTLLEEQSDVTSSTNQEGSTSSS